MKRLPPNKRNQLVITLLIIAALIGAIYFFLISPQMAENQRIVKNTGDKSSQLDKMRNLIKQADATAKRLADINAQLDKMESDVAKGDTYAWTYNLLREFKSGHKVDIKSIGQPAISDAAIAPQFPYKQVRVTLDGAAYYHDLGKFIADFENSFPHARLENLTIGPDESPGAPVEHLSFRMDMVALVKPNN